MSRKLFAEWLGTFFLLAVVVGSGITADRLSDGNTAIALLGNTIPTGAILVVLILMFGPISGAHFNPAVTFAFFLRKDINFDESIAYIVMQVFGGIAGVVVAHIMFQEPLLAASTTMRTGASQWVSELVATFGLVATIFGCIKAHAAAVPYAVGLYITAGYWFTSSTCFANPAVTMRVRLPTPSLASIPIMRRCSS